MFAIKTGVKLAGLQPAMILACIIVDQVYTEEKIGTQAVLTSALDGKHMRHSHHYKGFACDFRLLPETDQEIRVRVFRKIVERLNTQYQVILGNDHIHIEFDPAAGD